MHDALKLPIWGGLVLILIAGLGGAAAAQDCPDRYCVYAPAIFRNHPVDTTNPPEDWLERLNLYRSAAGLPAVIEEPSYSDDLASHVNYMLLNPDDIWHGESPDRPGYTPEGAQAAVESNLLFTGSGATDATAIDFWMGSVYHRYGMLRPELAATGFASDCNSEHYAFGLNVLRGLSDAKLASDGVVYPGANQRGVRTTEVVSWQFDPYYGPDSALTYPLAILSSAALYDSEGRSVPISTTTPDSYWNVVTAAPDEPLARGAAYTVEMTVSLGDRQLSRAWSFVTRH